jgi:hypothetical protein
MSAEIRKEIRLEIGHVLFTNIVGYSKLLIDEQVDVGPTLEVEGAPRNLRRSCYALDYPQMN